MRTIKKFTRVKTGKIIRPIAVILYLVLFAGCKKENLCDCFKGTGDDVTVTRELSGFDRLYIEDKLDVRITEAPVFEVTVEGGKKVVGLIKTKVVDGELRISNDNKCNMMRSYKRKITVHVKMPKLRWIVHSGLGTVSCGNAFTNDTITYQIFSVGDLHLDVNNGMVIGGINGMGDIYLRGTTYKHLTNVKGEGFVYADELKTNISDLVLSTSGLTYVNVSDQLIVHIYEGGDVYYRGNPPVIQKVITGTGQLKPN
jgi:hypothetical protein